MQRRLSVLLNDVFHFIDERGEQLKKILSAILVWGAVTLLSGTAMATNLITNGNFETGTFAGWQTSWIPGGAKVVDVGAPYGYAAELNDPTSFGAESLYQKFYVAPGTSELHVSFDYLLSGNAGKSRKLLSNDYFYAGLKVYSEDAGLFGIGDGWKNYSVHDDKSGSSTYNTIVHVEQMMYLSEPIIDKPLNGQICFSLLEGRSGNSKLLVDNIHVGGNSAAVPEPASMLLMGTGLAGLVWGRKKNKTAR